MGGQGETSPTPSKLPWIPAKAKKLGEVLPLQTLTQFKQVLRVEVYDGSRTDLVWDWVNLKNPRQSKPRFAHLDLGGTLRLAYLLLKAYMTETKVEDLEATLFILRKLFQSGEGIE